jgi:hypothetical protein
MNAVLKLFFLRTRVDVEMTNNSVIKINKDDFRV